MDRAGVSEPMPLCGMHPELIQVQSVGGPCQRCQRPTYRSYVVCGWCGEEQGTCVLCGGDLRNGRPDGWEYQR